MATPPYERCAGCGHQRRTHRELYLRNKCWGPGDGPDARCTCIEFEEPGG